MSRKQRPKRLDLNHRDIPEKANRILNLILVAFILVLIRIWHLSFIEYDQKVEEASKPQKKTLIEPAIRATIRDRFNLPLAINKIQYQAAILYSQINDMPSIVWEKDSNGKKVKKFKRKEYIQQLSQLMAKELNLDSERIADLIHAKATYYAQVPFVIKDEITEQEYYRLKMIEKDWPGVLVRKLPKRDYPRGRVGGDIIGYLGAINRQEYEKILQEMSDLERYIQADGEEPDFLYGNGWNIESVTQARRRLKDLQEKAYTIHDYIGKVGVEGVYEKQLRGFYGKKQYYTDSKGCFLQELPGSRPPLPGQRLLLTISAELQEFAEQLLAQNELIRITKLSHLEAIKKTILALKQPWMKGGAIVAMDPHTGEILTLATYPRFDPNDFIPSGNPEINRKKAASINRWFENETYLASLWNEQEPMERERYDAAQQAFFDEKRWVTWEAYLDFVLPAEGVLRKAIDKVSTVGKAVEIQKNIQVLQDAFEGKNIYQIINYLYPELPHSVYPITTNSLDKRFLEEHFQLNNEGIKKAKKRLDYYFEGLPQNYDKVLLVDLCRLALAHDRFSDELLQQIGKFSLSAYKTATAHFVKVQAPFKEKVKKLFHDIDFKAWRKKEEKQFLKQKRIEEKRAKSYQKPYLDYLDQQEEILFKDFWEKHRWDLWLAFLMGVKGEENVIAPYIDSFIDWHAKAQEEGENGLEWKKAFQELHAIAKDLNPQLTIQFFHSLRPYNELVRPLLGSYRGLRQRKNPLEKHLAAAFYPAYGYGYGRSYGYRQATIQGSIFKLVTAYEGLVQKYRKLGKANVSISQLNPLTIIDQVYTHGNNSYVGYTMDGKPIPQMYKGGRVPRSLAHQNNGEVDIIHALGVSSNPYFSLLAGDVLENPEDLPNAARLFSYGSPTGIDLPGEISGHVPNDVSKNRTGLYALAIGQHSLVATPLQTAVMLAAVANGGKILKPRIVSMAAGRQPARGEDLILCPPTFPYQEALSYAGIDFPLFAATVVEQQKSLLERFPIEIRSSVFMPDIVRYVLFAGLRLGIKRTFQESFSTLTRLYHQHPEAVQAMNDVKDQILGKTSTSESVETIDLDYHEGTNLYTHVWFGAIDFQKNLSNKNVSSLILKDEFGKPELIVVVYLRYGGYGKEAAPVAAQMIKKWRAIQEQKKAKVDGSGR